MRKTSIILGTAGTIIAVGIIGTILHNKSEQQGNTALVQDNLNSQHLVDTQLAMDSTEENTQSFPKEPGLKVTYVGEKKIYNVDITLDEINDLKVYTMSPPADEEKYVEELARYCLGDNYSNTKISVHTHESSAGPEFEGWGNRYEYLDKDTNQEYFSGGSYTSSFSIRITAGDTAEDVKDWIDQFTDRFHLGIYGEDIHYEWSAPTRTQYFYTPYFGKVPKIKNTATGVPLTFDKQGINYPEYPDMEFQYSGGTLVDAVFFSIDVIGKQNLSMSYASFDDILQKLFDALAESNSPESYSEFEYEKMNLYYNIGLRKNRTFAATPWVEVIGKEKFWNLEEGFTHSYTVTSYINLETGRGFYGGGTF